MRAGNFPAAWAICDRMLDEHRGVACGHLPRHQQWIWDGTPIDGSDVLIRCYHGLGDTIQFARYLPLVRARARSLTVWAQPRLMPLLRTMELFRPATADSACRLLPLHDGGPGADYDVDVEIMELPHLFRTTLDTIPNDVPYLHVAPMTLAGDGRPAIGLVWKAGDWDDQRSIPFEALAPLVASDARWYILQGAEAFGETPPRFGTCVGTADIMEAAAAMRALDLLITVDSMPAHLAGALGTPVWTLLPRYADWRWMEDRDDSPWYPSMRLFRQRDAGEWAPAVARVAAELRSWIATAA